MLVGKLEHPASKNLLHALSQKLISCLNYTQILIGHHWQNLQQSAFIPHQQHSVFGHQAFSIEYSLPNTHTHSTVLLLFWNMSRTTWVSRYQKGKTRKVKTNLNLLEQEIVSGSGIWWVICNAYSLRPPARSPPAGDTWVHLIPIVQTHRVPPCTVLGAFPR